MNVGNLHLSNNHRLDVVTPGVVQYTACEAAKGTHHFDTRRPSLLTRSSDNCLLSLWEDSSEYTSFDGSPSHGSIKKLKRKRVEDEENISLKRKQFVADGSVTESPVEVINARCTAVTEVLIFDERPERSTCREDQKREDFVTGLNNEIQDLRDKINMLELQHIRATATIPAADGRWDTVMGYFRVVRHRLPLAVDLLHFVSKAMDSNVLYNSEYGIGAMIRSWYFLHWFGDVNEELENVIKTAKHSMVATTTISFTITQQTLASVFPHLLRDDDFALRNKLLGQRIIMQGSTFFEWGRTGRVTSVIAQSDMLTPMLHLLGNWEDVSRVFENAVISPDFQWRSVC